MITMTILADTRFLLFVLLVPRNTWRSFTLKMTLLLTEQKKNLDIPYRLEQSPRRLLILGGPKLGS